MKRTLALFVLASLPALLPVAPLRASAMQTAPDSNGAPAQSQASSRASSHDRHNRHHRTINKSKHRQHHRQTSKK